MSKRSSKAKRGKSLPKAISRAWPVLSCLLRILADMHTGQPTLDWVRAAAALGIYAALRVAQLIWYRYFTKNAKSP